MSKGREELILDESSRTKLDGIVQQMSDNGEADTDILFVVEDFKTKYGQKKSLNQNGNDILPPSSPPVSGQSPEGQQPSQTNLQNGQGKSPLAGIEQAKQQVQRRRELLEGSDFQKWKASDKEVPSNYSVTTTDAGSKTSGKGGEDYLQTDAIRNQVMFNEKKVVEQNNKLKESVATVTAQAESYNGAVKNLEQAKSVLDLSQGNAAFEWSGTDMKTPIALPNHPSQVANKEIETLKSELNKFDFNSFRAKVDSYVDKTQTLGQELDKWAKQYKDGIPTKELWEQYNGMLNEYNTAATEQNKLIESPEYKKYQEDSVKYNSIVQSPVIAEQINAVNNYNEALKIYQEQEGSLKQSQKEFDTQKEKFNSDYSSYQRWRSLLDADLDKNYSYLEQFGSGTVAMPLKSMGAVVESLGDIADMGNPFTPKGVDFKYTDRIGRAITDMGKDFDERQFLETPTSYFGFDRFLNQESVTFKKGLHFAVQSLSSLAPSVGAAFLGGLPAGATAGAILNYGDAYESAKEAGMSDEKAILVSTAITIPVSLLDMYGLGKIMKSFEPNLASAISKVTIKKLAGKELTKESIFKAAGQSFSDILAKGGKIYAAAVVPETITEGGQELIQAGGLQLAEGRSPFTTKVLKQGIMGSIGGFIGGSVPAGIGAAVNASFNPSAYQFAMKATEEEIEMLKKDVLSQPDVYTEAEAKQIFENINAIKESDKKIPDSIDSLNLRTRAVNLLIEKEKLNAQMEGKDKALVAPLAERVKAIDEELTAIAKGEIAQPKKTDEKLQDIAGIKPEEKSEKTINPEVKKTEKIEDKTEVVKEETIFHGTTAEAAKKIEESGFDISKTADGTIWFTNNKTKIEGGEVAATGKGGVIERKIDESKLKLGGWEETDKYSTGELINMGYDGLKLVGENEITYQIFYPEKLSKVLKETPQSQAQKPVLADKEASANKEEGVVKTKLQKGEKEIYHHTVEPIENIKNRDEGVWFTENKFGAIGAPKDANVLAKVINPSELNLATDKQFMAVANKTSSWAERAKILKEQGFDGVKRTVDGDAHYWVFDLNKLKSKEQSPSPPREKASELKEVNKDTKNVQEESKKELPQGEGYKVGITSATFRSQVPQVAKRMEKAKALFNRGRFKEADRLYNEILDEGEKTIKEHFDKIDGAEIKLTRTKGNYGGLEPTFDAELIITKPESRQAAFNALADFAQTYSQEAVHVSRVFDTIPEGGEFGKENADGSVYEPNIEIRFDKTLTAEEYKNLSAEIQSVGNKGEELAGSTLHNDNKGVTLYNISYFKDHATFLEQIKQLAKKLQDNGGVQPSIKSNVRQLWNYGESEGAGGSTRTYKQLREGSLPDTVLPKEVTRPLSEVKPPEKSGEPPIEQGADELVGEKKEPTKGESKIPELTKNLKAAKEKKKAVIAKQKNPGAIKDVFRETEERAKADREILDAYVDLAKAYISEGIKTAEEFAKKIGEEISDTIRAAWSEAQPREAKERLYAKQILEDADIREEVRTGLSENAKTYIPITNALTQKEALAIIDMKGKQGALDMVKDKHNELKPAVRAMLGHNLIRRFNILDINKSIETAEFLTEFGTETGQGAQAFAVFQLLTPEGQLKFVAKQITKQRAKKIQDAEGQIEKKKAVVKKVNKEVIEEILDRPSVKKQLGTLSPEKLARKQELRKKFLSRFNDITQIASNLGDKEFLEYGKLIIEETAGDFKKFAAKAIRELGEKVKPILKEWYRKSGGKKAIGDIDAEIREGLKALDTDMKSVIKKHFAEFENTKKTLAEKLVAESGLTKAAAEKLSKEIQSEFDRIATRKKREALNKTLTIKERLSSKKTKLLHEALIELSNLGAFSDAKFTEMYADKMGFSKLTEAQAREIMRLAERVQNSPEGIPKFEATEDLLKYQAKLDGFELGAAAQSVWYANILSGFNTQLVNMVANIVNTGFELGVHTIKNPVQLPMLAKGLWNGWGRGLFDAVNVLQTGYSPIRGKIEVPNVLEQFEFKGGKWNPFNYAKFVQRAMMAADTFAFEGLQEMRAYELATMEARKEGHSVISKGIWKRVSEKLFNTKERLAEAQAQAKEEGLKGIQFKRRVYDIMELSRPQKMIEDTHTYAARGTFNHIPEGTLGMLSEGINRMIDGWSIKGVRPLKFLVPFTRVITNVTNLALEYTPHGFFRAWAGNTGFRSFESTSFAPKAYRKLTNEQKKEVFIKASTGLVAAALMYALSEPDDEGNSFIEITSTGAGDFKKNQELQDTGWQPYSIKIGEKWYSYQYTPLALVLAPIGHLRDGEKYRGEDMESNIEKMGMAMLTTAQLFVDMTFLSSISDFFENLGSAKSAIDFMEKTVAKTAKGLIVPNIYTQAVNEYRNIFDIPAKEANVWQNFYKDMPIAQNSLNNKVNALGEELPPDTDRFISNHEYSPTWDFIIKNRAWIGKPNKNTLMVFDGEIERLATEDEYYNYVKLSGQKIKEGIEILMTESQDMTPEEIRVEVKSIKKESREEAKEELFQPKED